jgi:tRNA U34 5-carboxymethylaminomethyl modifying enzyme MnmG/GidA
MNDSLITHETEQSMQMMRERNEYRLVLHEALHREAQLKLEIEKLREEVMPKIKNIFTRLHGGTDAMRDEGHKLWLIYNDLQQLTKELK